MRFSPIFLSRKFISYSNPHIKSNILSCYSKLSDNFEAIDRIVFQEILISPYLIDNNITNGVKKEKSQYSVRTKSDNP